MRSALLRPKNAHAGTLAVVALLALGVPDTTYGATETVNRTANVAANGTVTIRNFSGSVSVTGTDRTDVSVHAVRRASPDRLARIKLDVQSDGRDVTIEANKHAGERQDRDNVVETDLTIEVPRGVRLDVDAFSSPVRIQRIQGTDHHVKTFSGTLTLEQVAGPIVAESFSGEIGISTDGWKPKDRLQLKTFSGDIDVRLPAEASAAVQFDSFSGDLDSDLPLTLRSKSKRALRAELNGGDESKGAIDLRTFSGDVHLRK
jgi:DUF4097 and DUF4098 domain-containing protein YvlB